MVGNLKATTPNFVIIFEQLCAIVQFRSADRGGGIHVL
jgi:hypothetical protein